ncbi:hypothetical protein M067_1590 [Bacteroides fragilis str. J-143-4]|nr:hypothetical protein M067_1590 [Bacteroides fragilis str. J-143-4]
MFSIYKDTNNQHKIQSFQTIYFIETFNNRLFKYYIYKNIFNQDQFTT